ncbi:multidrug transporter, partial [Ectopseudomonas hydrolytica]
MRQSLLSMAVAAALLSGCSLIPDYQRPDAPVAADWPQGEAYGSAASEGSRAAADLQWREFFRDPALQQLVQVALENNRSLFHTLRVEGNRATHEFRTQHREAMDGL